MNLLVGIYDISWTYGSFVVDDAKTIGMGHGIRGLKKCYKFSATFGDCGFFLLHLGVVFSFQ